MSNSKRVMCLNPEGKVFKSLCVFLRVVLLCRSGINLAPYDGPSSGAQGLTTGATGSLGAGAGATGPASADPAPAPAAHPSQGVWQEVFRWEVEGPGERGLYEFHHLDTGLRLSVSGGVWATGHGGRAGMRVGGWRAVAWDSSNAAWVRYSNAHASSSPQAYPL